MTSIPYISPYATYDANNKTSVTAQFNQYYNLTNDSVLSEELSYDLDNQSFPGHTKDQLALIEGKFSELQKQYTEQTENMMIVNELMNVSDFMNESMSTEFNRISKLRDQTIGNVHKLRHQYMMTKFDTNYNSFISGIIQFTIFVLVICCLIITLSLANQETFSLNTAFFIIGIVLFIYTTLVIVFIRQSMRRRKDDWDKYYFGSMDKNSKNCFLKS